MLLKFYYLYFYKVRVPTHEDGRLIFWEFSTDFYDLGFGLYFEWTLSPSNNVTVHVSDSSDEEEGEGEEDGGKFLMSLSLTIFHIIF